MPLTAASISLIQHPLMAVVIAKQSLVRQSLTAENVVSSQPKTEALDPDGSAFDVEGSLKRLDTDYIDVLQFHGGWFYEGETNQILNGGGLEKYLQLKNEGTVRYIGFSADGPSGGTEQLIATNAFDMMQIHYNLMYQSTCDMFSKRGVIPDAVKQEMGIVLMRVNHQQRFPKSYRALFLLMK